MSAGSLQHQELEVVVRSWKQKDVGDARTVRELLSPMIDDARTIYERLYQIEVGASVRIVFKWSRKVSKSNTKGQEVKISEEVKTEGDAVIHPNSNGEGEEKDVREEATIKCVETTECMESISVLCKNEHPYVNKDVWEDTRGLMDSTILKGNIFLL